jgi:hypothetical protein
LTIKFVSSHGIFGLSQVKTISSASLKVNIVVQRNGLKNCAKLVKTVVAFAQNAQNQFILANEGNVKEFSGTY